MILLIFSASTMRTWVWQKLLKLRPQAVEFYRIKVNNGSTTWFLLYYWLPMGRLIDIMGGGKKHSGVWYAARCSSVRGSHTLNNWHEKVESTVAASHWSNQCCSFASTWCGQWCGNVETCGWFAIVVTRRAGARVIWFASRYAFITWLVIKDNFFTGARIQRLNLIQLCLLCEEPVETWNHLFVVCPCSFMIWVNIMEDLLGVRCLVHIQTGIRCMVFHVTGTIILLSTCLFGFSEDDFIMFGKN